MVIFFVISIKPGLEEFVMKIAKMKINHFMVVKQNKVC